MTTSINHPPHSCHCTCPITEKQPHVAKFGFVENELRGHDISKLINPPIEVIDNYHWLRDDSRTDQKILDHIDRENEYTDSIMLPHNELTQEIYKEVKSLIQENYDTYAYKLDETSPNRYFRRYSEGKNYPIYCSRLISGEEQILLDVNELAFDKEQCDVTSFEISPDHQFISYGVDYDGSELYSFVIQNIKTKEIIKTPIPEIAYCSYMWANSHLIYYLVGDETNNLRELWLYDLNTNSCTQLYEECYKTYGLGIGLSNDKQFVFVSSGDYDTNFVQFIDLYTDPMALNMFHGSLGENVKFSLEHCNGYWYIHTNLNAERWKIMRTSIDRLSVEFWEEFVPHMPFMYIDEFQVFKDFFVFLSKLNGNTYINISDYKKSFVNVITHLNNYNLSWPDYVQTDFSVLNSENVYTLDLGHNPVFSTEILNISFESLTSPAKLFDYNVYTFACNQVHESIVPNYNQSLYECKRLWAPSHDNVSVPISIVYRKDMYRGDRTNPLYLYGYGSYGITIDPSFDNTIIPLLDRGYVYAIAHVRGGAFINHQWYEDGRMYKKMNTFNDFISCAEYLGQICDPKRITIEGRSAGGLLVGAVTVLRPDLFHCVVAGVPFVDVLNSMCDSSIPLTSEEWSQWGNPNELEGYNYMKQYCPYTNIKQTNYPHMYCTCGLNDPRVQYFEALKFIAKLREFKTDDNTQVVKIQVERGHFGGSGRYQEILELAEKYAFVFTRTT